MKSVYRASMVLSIYALVYSMSLTWIMPLAYQMLNGKSSPQNESNLNAEPGPAKFEQVILSLSFFIGRMISFKIFYTIIDRLNKKKVLILSLFFAIVCNILTFALQGLFYYQCALRLMFGLFFPLDALIRICSLELSLQRYSPMHFHFVNFSILLGQMIVSLFNTDKFLDADQQLQVGIIVYSSQFMISVLAIIAMILTYLLYPRAQNLQYEIQESESQGGDNKNKINQQDQQQKKIGPDNQQYMPQKNEDNSLQLFESDTGREEDKNNPDFQNTQKKRLSINQKGLNLQLDEIDNISDCDLDSIKNTSARAITFNQFEITKNMLNQSTALAPGNDDSSLENLNNSKNIHDKLNLSHIDLMNQNNTELGSAVSSDRKNNANGFSKVKNRNSMGAFEDEQHRNSLFEKRQSSSNNDQKKLQGPYAQLNEDTNNQQTLPISKENNTHESSTSPQKQNQSQQEFQDINQIQMQVLMNQPYIIRHMVLLLLASVSLQFIEQKLFLTFQYPNEQGYGLNFQQTNFEYAKSCVLPLMLYVPLNVLLAKKMSYISLIKIVQGLAIIFILTDTLVAFNAITNHSTSLPLFTFTQAMQKSFISTLLFSLFVFGLRLVKISQRVIYVQYYYFVLNIGYAVGDILGCTLSLMSLSTSLNKMTVIAVQAAIVAISLGVSFSFKNVSEEELRSSSADVLNSAKRSEDQKQEEQQQNNVVIDPAVNLQYQNKRRIIANKMKHVSKSKKEKRTTNPNQPTEEITPGQQLNEEDDTDKTKDNLGNDERRHPKRIL